METDRKNSYKEEIHGVLSEVLDAVYLSQIASAQEFLNNNRNADLSRVKCLLHKLLPQSYFDKVDQLREQQDPGMVYHITGGQNIVAPQAQKAKQKIKK